MRPLFAPAVIASVALAAAPAAGERTGGPFRLVALNSLGTITWRCDAHDPNRHGLGYRQFAVTATTAVTLRAAGRTIRAVTTNSRDHVRFPLLRGPDQQLKFVQGTEPRTLRASVTVSFKPGALYCESYVPPDVTVRLSTSRH